MTSAAPSQRRVGFKFKNTQWKVTRYGLECRTTHYLIRAATLKHVRGALPEWPLHMAEKNWVDIHLFVDAFRAALDFHHVTFDATALDKSCNYAIALSEYLILHTAASNRIAEAQNIGSKMGGWGRCYDLTELLKVSDLADAALAAVGIYPPEEPW